MYLQPVEVPNRRIPQGGWKESLNRLRPQRYLKRISPFKPVEVENAGYLKEESLQPHSDRHDARENSLEMSSSTSSVETQEHDHDTGSSNASSDDLHPREQSEGSDMSMELYRRLPSLIGINLEDRDLPPLPQSPKKTKQQLSATLHRATSQGQTQLRRAATWLGRPFHRLAMSPQLHAMVDKYTRATSEPLTIASMPMPGACAGTSVVGESATDSDISELSLMTLEKEPAPFFQIVYGTDNEHFKFMRSQLAPSAAAAAAVPQNGSREGVSRKTTTLLCRVAQIVNLASSREYKYEIHMQIDGVTKQTHNGIMKKAAKGISADRPKEDNDWCSFEVDENTELSFVVAGRSMRSVQLADRLARFGVWADGRKETQMPIIGFARMATNVDSLTTTVKKGKERFKLQNMIKENKSVDFELTLDFRVEQRARPYPWDYHQLPALTSVEIAEPVADPQTLEEALIYCQNGDFLTFYMRGTGMPTWKRFWARLIDGRLELRDFTYKQNKGLVASIPLLHLKSVTKPTEDDQELVCIGRQIGLVLQFDRKSATMIHHVHLEENEGLYGKIFVLTDGVANSAHWRHALLAHASAEHVPLGEGGVDLRFLW